MQKELAASGLSPEEILAKTLLLQVTFLFFCCCSSRQLANNIMQLRWQYYNNYYHQKCLAGDNSPAFINKTLKNALNVANISPEDLAKVIFVRILIIRSVSDSCWFDTVYSCSVSDKIDFSWQWNDKNKLNVNLFMSKRQWRVKHNKIDRQDQDHVKITMITKIKSSDDCKNQISFPPQSLYVEKAMAASGASPEDIAKTLLIQVWIWSRCSWWLPRWIS